MNEIIIFLAKYLIYLMAISGVAVGWAILRDKKKFLSYLLKLTAALIVVALADLILGQLFPSARPFVTQGVAPLFPHEAGNSFPSSHAAYAAVLASFIWLQRRDWGVVAMGAAILIGLARVWSQVHYPIDVMGGLIIGIGTAYLTNRFWPGR